MNERAVVKMTPPEVEEFLRARHDMTLCSVNHDGSIHAVAMWYGFLEGAVAVETKAKSQKVQNLRRDPRMTCLVQAGKVYEELRGVELVGTGEIVEDPDRLWAVGVSVFERYVGPYTDARRPEVESMLRKRVGIRLHVERVVSWDHTKLTTRYLSS